MSKNLVKIIEQSQIKIKKITLNIENELANIDYLTVEEIDELNKNIDIAKKIMHSIKESCKVISSKVNTKIALKTPTVKAKLKDKSSYAFNELLLHQGKPAKALSNLEDKAKKGDLESQFLTGKTYLQGVIGYYGDVKMKDSGLGLKWLTVAYKNGHQDAGYLIASYEKSVLNTKNAIKLFEKLGKDGHRKSLEELLNIYGNDPKHQDMSRVLDIKNEINNM